MPLALIILLPLFGFLINGLIGRRLPKPVPGIIACLAVLLAFVVAVARFINLAAQPEDARTIIETAYTWMAVGDLKISVALRLDQLSAVMILIITGVGFLIHLYSVGYMAHDHNDPDGVLNARYFSFLNLFIAFMSLLVLANNYLLMFVGWEGVGLCSYFLIGYWFQFDEAAEAAKKAFIVNRIGDFGFLLGIMLIFLTVGALDYDAVFSMARDNPEAFDVGIAGAMGGIVAITLLLTLGATGKSAQIPLFVWLPDAMAGPTPVSALIHAATMVTAGVYMAARSSALFDLAPQTKLIVCGIGALTAFAAALTALAHTDIKKVLAYSTVSQLGFMFMAIGSGAYVAAIFHVFTHAFFKACLFLGAGSVIHALHGEQDMRKMGGLATKMKATNLTFLLSGLALAGAAPFAGFFSKDEIIAQIYEAGGTHSIYFLFVAVALVTAFITAIYTGRQYSMIFLGERRDGEASTPSHESPEAHPEHAAQEPTETEEPTEAGAVLHAHDAHLAHEVHESPPIMTLPLWILAAGAVLTGFLGVPHVPGVPAQLHAFANWLDPLFPRAADAAESHINWALLLIGLVIGWAGWIMGRSLGMNARRAMLPEAANRLSLDQVYNGTVVKVGFALAALLRWVDEKIIDGIVNLVGGFVGQVGAGLRLTQTSFISDYALAMAVGAAIVIFFLAGAFWPL